MGAKDHDQDFEEVTPPPVELGAAAERAWSHADAIGRRLEQKLEHGLERLGTRVEQSEGRVVRVEGVLSELVGRDGRGGDIGAVKEQLKDGKSTRTLVLGQAIGLTILLVGAALGLYSRLTSLEDGMGFVRERQQQFETRIERTLDKLEARTAAPAGPRAVP